MMLKHRMLVMPPLELELIHKFALVVLLELKHMSRMLVMPQLELELAVLLIALENN